MTFDLHFSKMQALGNDYVYVETLSQRLKNPETLAKRLSDRHFGIGSDGMILICPSECADFRMRVFDPGRHGGRNVRQRLAQRRQICL